MNALVKTACTFVTSSIGRKVIVALTGLSLVLFLAGHLVGNLLIYGGPETINAYAYGLHSMPAAALWAIRLGLLVIFLIHVFLTIQLKLENKAARGSEGYKKESTIAATLSSRYMIYSGLTILVFAIFHILQYTTRVNIDPANYAFTFATGALAGTPTFNVFQMIVDGFSNVWVSAFYVLAVLMLFSHLRHGVQSIFQTVGLNSRKIRPLYNLIAIVYATVVCLGFVSIPLSVLAGFIK
jgi:succinate dehydrogenase / fumarate reductase cytochrome b subunit